jgi:hypothetical protein
MHPGDECPHASDTALGRLVNLASLNVNLDSRASGSP